MLVFGYSFGTDVAAFLVNRRPAAMRMRIVSVSLLGPSGMASFAFRLASWFGGGGEPRFPTAPEIARVTAPVTCIYGADEVESVCRALAGTRVRATAVGEGQS